MVSLHIHYAESKIIGLVYPFGDRGHAGVVFPVAGGGCVCYSWYKASMPSVVPGSCRAADSYVFISSATLYRASPRTLIKLILAFVTFDSGAKAEDSSYEPIASDTEQKFKPGQGDHKERA